MLSPGLCCDAIFLSSEEIYRSRRYKIHSIQIFVRGGRKLNNTENEREKKQFVPLLLLAANECHGIIANARWIISLMVQYNVRHLALSLW